MIFLGCSNERTSKNEAVTMKFYDQLFYKCDVQAVFLITSGKQMSNSYVPCFNIINYVISS